MEKKECPAKILGICIFAGPGCTFDASKECPVYPEIEKKIKEGFSNGKWVEACPILVLKGYPYYFCDILSLKKKFKGKCWYEKGKEMVCLLREKFSEKEIIQALLKSK